MKILLKIVRNGLGYLIAGISWLLMPKSIKRSQEEQDKINEKTKNLTIYQFFACPFCIKTRRTIRKLSLKIETIEVGDDNIYRTELLEKGGKIQVPCLKIKDGESIIWLYESDEITKYLEKL